MVKNLLLLLLSLALAACLHFRVVCRYWTNIPQELPLYHDIFETYESLPCLNNSVAPKLLEIGTTLYRNPKNKDYFRTPYLHALLIEAADAVKLSCTESQELGWDLPAAIRQLSKGITDHGVVGATRIFCRDAEQKQTRAYKLYRLQMMLEELKQSMADDNSLLVSSGMFQPGKAAKLAVFLQSRGNMNVEDLSKENEALQRYFDRGIYWLQKAVQESDMVAKEAESYCRKAHNIAKVSVDTWHRGCALRELLLDLLPGEAIPYFARSLLCINGQRRGLTG